MNRKIALYRKLIINAGERQGWGNSEGIVAALSGGGDSVAMLWLLRKFYRGRIVAAHLDHCTRDGMSHKDAEFVRELCAKWDVECRVKTVDVHAEKMQGESFEMAGRRVRYEHFRQTAEAEGLRFIAVAHSLDDLVETQLMNLFRGTGLAGLRGIPERNGDIVRPIIDFRRQELRELLIDNEVPWREDESNTDRTFKRNRVRCDLIPWIKKNMNPNFEVTMAGLARQINSVIADSEERARANVRSVSCSLAPAEVCWKTAKLKEFSAPDLAEMFRLQGEILGLPVLSRARTDELVRLTVRGGSWRFQWAEDMEICRSDRGMGWIRRSNIGSFTGENQQNKNKDILPWWARLRDM